MLNAVVDEASRAWAFLDWASRLWVTVCKTCTVRACALSLSPTVTARLWSERPAPE
jgi:hypothetical protein